MGKKASSSSGGHKHTSCIGRQMHKWKHGPGLHSGVAKRPVKSQRQAVAIAASKCGVAYNKKKKKHK
jgi:hypothetical protein